MEYGRKPHLYFRAAETVLVYLAQRIKAYTSSAPTTKINSFISF